MLLYCKEWKKPLKVGISVGSGSYLTERIPPTVATCGGGRVSAVTQWQWECKCLPSIADDIAPCSVCSCVVVARQRQLLAGTVLLEPLRQPLLNRERVGQWRAPRQKGGKEWQLRRGVEKTGYTHSQASAMREKKGMGMRERMGASAHCQQHSRCRVEQWTRQTRRCAYSSALSASLKEQTGQTKQSTVSSSGSMLIFTHTHTHSNELKLKLIWTYR